MIDVVRVGWGRRTASSMAGVTAMCAVSQVRHEVCGMCSFAGEGFR